MHAVVLLVHEESYLATCKSQAMVLFQGTSRTWDTMRPYPIPLLILLASASAGDAPKRANVLFQSPCVFLCSRATLHKFLFLFRYVQPAFRKRGHGVSDVGEGLVWLIEGVRRSQRSAFSSRKAWHASHYCIIAWQRSNTDSGGNVDRCRDSAGVVGTLFRSWRVDWYKGGEIISMLAAIALFDLYRVRIWVCILKSWSIRSAFGTVEGRSLGHHRAMSNRVLNEKIYMQCCGTRPPWQPPRILKQ